MCASAKATQTSRAWRRCPRLRIWCGGSSRRSPSCDRLRRAPAVIRSSGRIARGSRSSSRRRTASRSRRSSKSTGRWLSLWRRTRRASSAPRGRPPSTKPLWRRWVRIASTSSTRCAICSAPSATSATTTSTCRPRSRTSSGLFPRASCATLRRGSRGCS
eukprot:Amastigsp_a512268_8.p3 type:complete len:160 gc:universal Amastigsp_a512268_8:331-810(+)